MQRDAQRNERQRVYVTARKQTRSRRASLRVLAGPVSFTHFFLRCPGNRRVPRCTFSIKHERVRRVLLKPFVIKHVSPNVHRFCSHISVESADVSALGSRLSDAERRLGELHTQTSGELPAAGAADLRAHLSRCSPTCLFHRCWLDPDVVSNDQICLL